MTVILFQKSNFPDRVAKNKLDRKKMFVMLTERGKDLRESIQCLELKRVVFINLESTAKFG